MEFTPQEAKYSENMRIADRSWRKLRWVSLGVSILFISKSVLMGWFLHLLAGMFGEKPVDAMSVLFLILIWTKLCMYLVVGLWLLMKVRLNWNGDMHRKLLLKLLDAQVQEKEKSKGNE
jgi:hypothetical protein